MGSKLLLFGLFLIQVPLLTTGQQQNLYPSSNFARFTNDVKSVVFDYMEQNKIEDYQIIIEIKKDTINLYLNSFTSLAGVGHLETFMCYKINDKNLYLFMVDGIRWKKDTAFNIQKSEAVFGENPTWLITLSENGMTLKKGVREYFAPPLPPKGYKAKYKPPVIDSTILRK
jgi:hypothetical protein